MGQVHHGGATTTAAVRRAIQHSQESLRVQTRKRELYDTYRSQLMEKGYGRTSARAEVDACKAAFRKRRAAAKNQQAVEERDALVAEIYDEISSPRARGALRTCARGRARGRIRP